MKIKKVTWGIVDANSYLIVEGKKALLIDAVDSDTLYEAIGRIDDLTVILTHCHFDHINGLNRLREIKKDAIIVATSKCSVKIGSSYKNMSSTANVFLRFYENKSQKKTIATIEPFVAAPADVTFEDCLSFQWEGHKVDLFSVFGHSDDGLLAVIDEKFLFTGDSLMQIPTVTRFPSGSTRQFWEHDIPLISSLKGRLLVYPGHGAGGKMSDMLKVNIPPEKIDENH